MGLLGHKSVNHPFYPIARQDGWDIYVLKYEPTGCTGLREGNLAADLPCKIFSKLRGNLEAPLDTILSAKIKLPTVLGRRDKSKLWHGNSLHFTVKEPALCNFMISQMGPTPFRTPTAKI